MHLEPSSLVLLSSVLEEVADTAGVAPLVVVPGDELDEVLVELDTRSGIEDRGRGVAGEVGGDDSVLGVVEDTGQVAGGLLLDGGLDVGVGGGLLEADDEVDDGDVEGRDTEGETTARERSEGG